MKQFRGGLVVKARRLVYHSTLGSRVIKKMKKDFLDETAADGEAWWAGLDEVDGVPILSG